MPETETIALSDRKAYLQPKEPWENYRKIRVTIKPEEVNVFSDRDVKIFGDMDGFLVEVRAGKDFEFVGERIDAVVSFHPWRLNDKRFGCTLQFESIAYL